MSATVAAALKKIAVAVLTDKKLRRTVLGIILGVIIIIIMPVAAVISLFNGDIEIDTDRLQTLVVENLSAEEKAKLQAVLPFKQPSDFVQDRSFRVGHDIGGMALQKGRFCEKSCFAAARTADDKNVFVSRVFRLFRPA